MLREREPEETEGLRTEENRDRERQPETEIKTSPEASRVGETRGVRGEARGSREGGEEKRRAAGGRLGCGLQSCDRPEAAASPQSRHTRASPSRSRRVSASHPEWGSHAPHGAGPQPRLCFCHRVCLRLRFGASGRVCVGCVGVTPGMSVCVSLPCGWPVHGPA